MRKILGISIFWALVAGALLGLVSCGDARGGRLLHPPPEPERVPGPTVLETVTFEGGDTLSIIRLADGTRCAVFDGYKAGGVDCDWKPSANP